MNTPNTPRLRREGGISSSSFVFYLYWYSYIGHLVCGSASEFGAMGSILPFWIYLFAVHGLSERTTVQTSSMLYCEQEKPAHCHGSLLLRLDTHQIQNRTRDAHKISPHGTMTKRTPAMNWDHAVSWGGGLG